jgi:carbonic anhydrase
MCDRQKLEFVSRRALVAGGIAGIAATASGLLGGAALAAPPPGTAQVAPPSLTPDQVLRQLKDGNAAFLAGRPIAGDVRGRRRLEIARAQYPIAVLVSCSDSRVPPEVLFGKGLGELFIIRNAGNTIDTAAMGSLEYAVTELNVPLVVVMGHERCGAVAAAVSVVENGATFPGSIGRMVEPIVRARTICSMRRCGRMFRGPSAGCASSPNRWSLIVCEADA